MLQQIQALLLCVDEALRASERRALPEYIDVSDSKLHQFEKYVCNVFGLRALLASFVALGEHANFDSRGRSSWLHTPVFRIPSLERFET